MLPKAGYPQEGSCLCHSSITKSIPIPCQDRRCLTLFPPVEEKAAVGALPQPSLQVMEIAMAGTSPIILLMTQNRLQLFLPRGAVCQPLSSRATEGTGHWVDSCSQLS